MVSHVSLTKDQGIKDKNHNSTGIPLENEDLWAVISLINDINIIISEKQQ